MSSPADLSDTLLDSVHSGASPIAPPDRVRYYTIISRWLDATVLVTPAGLQEAIRGAQRELLRPPVEAL
jgi:hypothetical protein